MIISWPKLHYFVESVRFGASIGGHMNLNFVDCEKVRQLSKNLGFVYQGNFCMNLHRSRRLWSSDMLLLLLNSCNSHLEALFGVMFHWHRWYHFIFSHKEELKITFLTIMDNWNSWNLFICAYLSLFGSIDIY